MCWTWKTDLWRFHHTGSAANISVPNTSGQTDRFVRFTNLCMNQVSINPAYGTGKSITVEDKVGTNL